MKKAYPLLAVTVFLIFAFLYPKATLVSSSVLVIYALLGCAFFYALKTTRPKQEQQIAFSKTKVWQFLSIAILGNLFALIFSLSENCIYFWDSFTYWNKSIVFSDLLYSNPFQALDSLYTSILKEEYSYVPTIFLGPFLQISKAYPVFVLAVFNLYYLPFLLLCSLLFDKIDLHKRPGETKKPWINLMTILLFCPFFTPVLYGYIDAVGLPFMALFLLVVYQDDFTSPNWKRNIVLALLLVFFLLERRWFTFWFVSYFTAIGLVWVMKYFFERSAFPFEHAKSAFLNLVLIGLLCLAVLVSLFYGLFERTFFGHYDDVYSAYKSPSIWIPLTRLVDYFGWVIIALAVVGIVYGCLKATLRWFNLFLLLHVVVTFALFSYVQDFGIHHYYLLASILVVFCKLGLDAIQAWTKFRFAKYALLALLLVNFQVCYVPGASKITALITPLLTKERFYPRTRNDLAQLQELVEYLKIKTAKRKTVYAIGSTPTFNSYLIQNASMPKESNPVPTLLPNRDVDKRDGFPLEALYADMVVVASPIQYHQRPEDQLTVIELANLVFANSGENKSYRFLKSFGLDNEVQAMVYEKIAPLPLDTLKKLKAKFTKRYADHPDLTNFNYHLQVLSEFQPRATSIEIHGSTSLTISPHVNASLQMKLEKKFSKVSFELLLKDNPLAPIGEIEKSTSAHVKVLTDSIALFDGNVVWPEKRSMLLDVKNTGTLHLQITNHPNNDKALVLQKLHLE